MSSLSNSYTDFRYLGNSFSSHFMAIKNIQDIIRERPEDINISLINLVERILKYPGHEKQKLAVILYREAALLLSEIATKTNNNSFKKNCFNILKKFSLNILNRSSLSSSLALGTLPLDLPNVKLERDIVLDRQYPIELTTIIEALKINPNKNIKMGRSILWHTKDKNRLVVFKFAKGRGDIKNLLKEVRWINYLSSNGWSRHFLVPELFDLKGNFLFSSKEYNNPFICLIVPKDYFIYPNGLGLKPKISSLEFLDIISKNSKILGMLSANGIFHTAIIPLFHNRVQRSRRDDGGLYLWERGGRLDRWLSSSLFPNIGRSGIRDFEHLSGFNNESRRWIFREIGNQILSLLLIVGSYFRMKEPKTIGRDHDGNPIDVRHLFDKELIKKAIYCIIKGYYLGFIGDKLEELEFRHIDILVRRMIEEMGVDNYMEETLRVADQEIMSKQEFEKFLLKHGYTKEHVQMVEKGKSDITLITGPHLGEFNNRISIPELIDFTGSMSGLLISSKYLKQNLNK